MESTSSTTKCQQNKNNSTETPSGQDDYVDSQKKHWRFLAFVNNNNKHLTALLKEHWLIKGPNHRRHGTTKLLYACRRHNCANERGPHCRFRAILLGANSTLYTFGEHNHPLREGETPKGTDDYVDKYGKNWPFFARINNNTHLNEIVEQQCRLRICRQTKTTIKAMCRCYRSLNCPMVATFLKANSTLYLRGQHNHDVLLGIPQGKVEKEQQNEDALGSDEKEEGDSEAEEGPDSEMGMDEDDNSQDDGGGGHFDGEDGNNVGPAGIPDDSEQQNGEVPMQNAILEGNGQEVMVVRQQEKIGNEAIVEPGQQHVDDHDQPTTSSNAPIQEPPGEESSSGAVPTTVQNLAGNPPMIGEEQDIAENEHDEDEAVEFMQEDAEMDDEPNSGGDHDNQNGLAFPRNLEENASNEGGSSLDVPMQNITIKEEYPEPHRSVGPGCWSPNTNYTNANWAVPPEIKRENNVNWPAEIDETFALQEQQPTTSKAARAPQPTKRVKALRKKRELEALMKDPEIAPLLKDREDRANHKRSLPSILKNSIEPMPLPDPAAKKKPTRPKHVPKKK